MGRVQRERPIGDKIEPDTPYDISRLEPDARRRLDAIRSHCGIENSFHGVLDRTLGADASRIRTGDSPQHRAVWRRLALNILKQDPSKGSLRQKRYKAALDDTFLSHWLDLV